MKAGYENELIICKIYFVVNSLGGLLSFGFNFFLFFLPSPPKVMMIVAYHLGFSCCESNLFFWKVIFFSGISGFTQILV